MGGASRIRRTSTTRTGPYYFRARFYSPSLQRFVSEDPLRFLGGGANLFNCVAEAPTRYTDPPGEVVFSPSPGTFPACERPRGRKDPSWWDRLSCNLELGQALPVPAAVYL